MTAGTGPDASGRAVPRTLAEELRTRPDEALAALLRARPDLLSPVPERPHPARHPSRHPRLGRTGRGTARPVRPPDRRGPGGRAGPVPVRDVERPDDGGRARGAEARAPRTARAPAPPPPPPRSATGSPPSCRAPSPRCATQALVWGGDDRLRLVRTARELLAPSPTSPSPTGLGPDRAGGHGRDVAGPAAGAAGGAPGCRPRTIRSRRSPR